MEGGRNGPICPLLLLKFVDGIILSEGFIAKYSVVYVLDNSKSHWSM